MSDRDVWIHIYTVCRQTGANDSDASANADAAIEKIKLLSNLQEAN